MYGTYDSEFMNSKNESVSRETLLEHVSAFIPNTQAHYAMRAIMQAIQAAQAPQLYMIDIARDCSLLHADSPERFVYCIRERGTDIFYRNRAQQEFMHTLESFNAHVKVFGTECHWYTYDINDVRQGDNYNEPQLRECDVETARAFLNSTPKENWA